MGTQLSSANAAPKDEKGTASRSSKLLAAPSRGGTAPRLPGGQEMEPEESLISSTRFELTSSNQGERHLAVTLTATEVFLPLLVVFGRENEKQLAAREGVPSELHLVQVPPARRGTLRCLLQSRMGPSAVRPATPQIVLARKSGPQLWS